MLNKSDIFHLILKKYKIKINNIESIMGIGYAPTNIAICKYWGKRNDELNLPTTSSLSISLKNKGCTIFIQINNQNILFLNNKKLSKKNKLYLSINDYLNHISNTTKNNYLIYIETNVHIACGLASSACIFAALVNSIASLYRVNFSYKDRSILARLGSGSSCRSFWHGFVYWEKGVEENGLDCYAKKIDIEWPELRIGILILNTKPKKISSRKGMQIVKNTSALYCLWPTITSKNIQECLSSIKNKDFSYFGQIAEQNSLTMHAISSVSWPAIIYNSSKTISIINKIHKLRQKYGLNVFFTQDAGPNIKLLFLQKDTNILKQYFPNLEIEKPFS